VVTFNLSSTLWPWTAQRQQWAAAAAEDQRTLRVLEQQGVTAVIGPYWLVYPLNFLSGEKILAIPIDTSTDFRHEIERLPPTPMRWALMTFRAEDLAPWARAAGVTGERRRLGSSFELLMPRYDVPAKRFRELLAIAWWNRQELRLHARRLDAYVGQYRDLAGPFAGELLTIKRQGDRLLLESASTPQGVLLHAQDERTATRRSRSLKRGRRSVCATQRRRDP
jgi:hypothetical protein